MQKIKQYVTMSDERVVIRDGIFKYECPHTKDVVTFSVMNYYVNSTSKTNLTLHGTKIHNLNISDVLRLFRTHRVELLSARHALQIK